MLDDETVAFLEGGVSLVVGMVLPDGSPYGCHGWGLTVLTDTPGPSARLVIGTRDACRVPELASGASIAVTAADVPTLRTLQLKGRSIDAGPATDDDLRVVRCHSAEFFEQVHHTDGEPPELLARMLPPTFTTCVVRFDAMFDQTPGLGAGARLGGDTGTASA